jgi:hypothetical protein
MTSQRREFPGENPSPSGALRLGFCFFGAAETRQPAAGLSYSRSSATGLRAVFISYGSRLIKAALKLLKCGSISSSSSPDVPSVWRWPSMDVLRDA